jgi:hypothetical protein
VFENRMLRRVFGPEWEEVAEDWRILHDEELYDLYSSPNIVRLTKSMMRWVRNLACMEEIRNAYKILVQNLKGKNHTEHIGIEWKVI